MRAQLQQQCTHPYVVNKDLLESIWANVSHFLVCAITYVWHLVLAFETPSDPVVDTLGFAPVGLQMGKW